MDGEICALVREAAKRVTGSNHAFIDHDIAILKTLAQRAVIAGLAADGGGVWLEVALNASLPTKKDHEDALGHRIRKATAEPIRKDAI